MNLLQNKDLERNYDWIRFFRPARKIVVFLASLPILSAIGWIFVFYLNFDCYSIQDCRVETVLLIIFQNILKFSPLIFLYLIICLIFYLGLIPKRFFGNKSTSRNDIYFGRNKLN